MRDRLIERWGWSLPIAGIFLFLPCSYLTGGGATSETGSFIAGIEKEYCHMYAYLAPAIVAYSHGSGLSTVNGTGVLVSDSGHILTCLSNLGSAVSVKIVMCGGRRVDARLIAKVEAQDIGLLKVDLTDTPFIPVSDRLADVGEGIFQLGNGNGVFSVGGHPALSSGIVSGHWKHAFGEGPKTTLLELDTGVNDGAFGGALVDMNGRLVGILAAPFSYRRWLGTAVPVGSFLSQLETKLTFKLSRHRASGVECPLLELLHDAYRKAASSAAPGVVTVEAEFPEEDDSTLRLRKDHSETGFESRYKLRPRPAVGSGVVIATDGYVVTSSFNVDGATSLSVVLESGTRLQAEVLGRNGFRDIALLKVKATGLAMIPKSDSDSVIGDWAIVVGRDSVGAPHTITRGIVSATGRRGGVAVQTDACVNYGNTGGAVVDIRGRLVGIASQVFTDTKYGVNSGVSFFTPIKDVEKIIPELRKGKVTPRAPDALLLRKLLGIYTWGSNLSYSPVVVSNARDPAAQAGVKRYDTIMGINGTRVVRLLDALDVLNDEGRRDPIELELKRGEETLKVHVMIGGDKE